LVGVDHSQILHVEDGVWVEKDLRGPYPLQ
jgi:hypothetical protein